MPRPRRTSRRCIDLALVALTMAGCPGFRTRAADVPEADVSDGGADAGLDAAPYDVPAIDRADVGGEDQLDAATEDRPDATTDDRQDASRPDVQTADVPDAPDVPVIDRPDATAVDVPSMDVPVDRPNDAGPDVVDAGPDVVDAGPPNDSGVFAPRPIGPPVGAIVTVPRPTLRWDLAGSLVGASVQVCRDRACTMTEAAFDQRGYSGVVTADLPAGAHFWRMRGLLFSGAHVDVWSDTWEFWVSPLRPPRENAFGSVLDLDGDGRPEVAVGAPGAEGGAGRVYIWRGPVGATPPAPDAVLSSVDGSPGFGAVVACVGDVDGDGYTDLGVSAYDESASRGTVEIFHGGPGLALRRGARLAATEGLTFGFSLDGAGDTNVDGYADVIVGQPQAAGGRGRAHVFLGRRGGLNTVVGVSLQGADQVGANFGWSVAGQADFDGDTRSDVVVGARGVSAEIAGAYAYLGTDRGFFPTIYNRLNIDGDPTSGFGSVVAHVGDINDDGFSDLVIGAPGDGTSRGKVLVHTGTGLGVSTDARANLLSPTIPAGGLGTAVTALGDVDGDGIGDFAASAPALGANGRATVFHGARTITTSLRRSDLDGTTADASFGAALANVDILSRGLVVGCPRESTTDGRVRGYDPAGGALPVASTRVFSAGSRARFGASLAGAW